MGITEGNPGKVHTDPYASKKYNERIPAILRHCEKSTNQAVSYLYEEQSTVPFIQQLQHPKDQLGIVFIAVPALPPILCFYLLIQLTPKLDVNKINWM